MTTDQMGGKQSRRGEDNRLEEGVDNRPKEGGKKQKEGGNKQEEGGLQTRKGSTTDKRIIIDLKKI
jgi:hypothetical protein